MKDKLKENATNNSKISLLDTLLELDKSKKKNKTNNKSNDKIISSSK